MAYDKEEENWLRRERHHHQCGRRHRGQPVIKRGKRSCAGGGTRPQRIQAVVPHQTGKQRTAATIALLDCGSKKPEPGQHLPCPHKLRPIALAEVLMKLTESCVIEQHTENLLKGVEPTNLGLSTPDAAALIVRIVRGWACDIAATPKGRAGRRRHPSNRPGERLRQSFSVNVPGSGETRLLATCCSLCGTVGTLRDKVLAAMRRRLYRGTACQEAGGTVHVPCTSCSCWGWGTPSPSWTPQYLTGSRGLGCRMA